jgi:hypothetical protein
MYDIDPEDLISPAEHFKKGLEELRTKGDNMSELKWKEVVQAILNVYDKDELYVIMETRIDDMIEEVYKLGLHTGYEEGYMHGMEDSDPEKYRERMLRPFSQEDYPFEAGK